jgi:site-specific recombinase XerD
LERHALTTFVSQSAVSEFQRLEQIIQVETAGNEPSDRFNRTWFYLLAYFGVWHSELLNLRLPDCDLNGKRLRVQAGKGDRDRVIPFTDHLVPCLQAYSMVRESAPTDHLLVYRGSAVKPHLIPDRLQCFGQKAGIEGLSPHRLRHTLATFLINQGMPITSLQRLLGHQDINKTLIYARIHDATVQGQFASAMAKIEAVAVADWPTRQAEISSNIAFVTQQIRDSV